MKGVVLAGGLGTRLLPLTRITNKHLLPVFDRPMIYYPLQTLINAGIRDILIVTGGAHAGDFLRLLGNGKDFGLARLHYAYQEGEGGIAAALALAEHFADQGVAWFEEPVSSDDLDGLRLIRDRAPAGMAIAAGEYGYDSGYFRRMLEAGAVDVLQADATRCGGVSGFLDAAALADAAGLPLSAHCGPSLHTVLGCACERVEHIEYFHDHARLESDWFEGAPEPRSGMLAPDPARPGLGFSLRAERAASHRIASASKER